MNFDVAYAYFESISKFDTSTLPFIIILFILLCIFINALFILIQSMNYLDVTKIPDKQFIYMVVMSFILSLFICSIYFSNKVFKIDYQDFLNSPFYNSLNLPEKDFAKQQLTILIKKDCSKKCQQGEHKLLLSDVRRIVLNIQNSNMTIPSYQDMILLEKSLTTNGNN
jgi:hypothetical protein